MDTVPNTEAAGTRTGKTCTRSGHTIEGDDRCSQCRFVGYGAPFVRRPATGELMWPVCPT